MVKSCRRYWTQEIADSIVQLEHIRFDNPMFSLTTTFNREDFTQAAGRANSRSTRQAVHGVLRRGPRDELLRRPGDDHARAVRAFFPGREDVIRLLMEPITYANGSTLEDPAISYGIVFSNFMSKGVFTFEGGTDRLIGLMETELRAERRRHLHQRATSTKIDCRGGQRARRRRSTAARSSTRAVMSNANLNATIFKLVGEEYFDRAVRRRRPGGAAQQFEHAGLHGAQAGRDDRRSRRATCCSARRRRCSAPSCC